MYKRWKFTALLVSLLLLLVVHPLLQISDSLAWVYKILFVFVFAGAFSVLFQHRQSRAAAFVLAIPSIAGTFFHSWIPASSPIFAAMLFHAAPVMLLGYTTIVVLRTIFRDAGVSADSINGAFAGYLLLGLMFGHFYCLVETVVPGSFTVPSDMQSHLTEANGRFSLMSYYSLMTLTTVGYGDITPKSAAARSIACVEAIIGQFYMAVIVAELIALKVSAAILEQRPSDSRPSDATGAPTESK